jgi:hypothetical protein
MNERTFFHVLSIPILVIMATNHWQDGSKKEPPKKEEPLIILTPETSACKLTLNASPGKTATIDFCNDKVEYSGNFPVAESAKIFFDAFLAERQRCQNQLKKETVK